METKDVDLEALLAEPQEAVDPAGASAEKVTEDSPSDGGTPPQTMQYRYEHRSESENLLKKTRSLKTQMILGATQTLMRSSTQ